MSFAERSVYRLNVYHIIITVTVMMKLTGDHIWFLRVDEVRRGRSGSGRRERGRGRCRGSGWS